MFFGVVLIVLILEGHAPRLGLDHARGGERFRSLCAVRRAASGRLGAPQLRRRAPGGPPVHDARGHLRRRRWTCPRRSSSCSPFTARSCSTPAPASSSSIFPSRRWAASPTSAGRTVVLASFLLGGPSGSGVATTVTLGSVAYPMLAKAGYGKNAAGGLLAAGGLGAIISPPVLGAAAFLIAEFLKISYLDVILMATIPTLPLLLRAVPHGRDRRAQVRHEGRAVQAGGVGLEPDQKVLVPFPVAGLDRRVHADGLFAGAVGVLGHGGGVCDQLSASRLRPVLRTICSAAADP